MIMARLRPVHGMTETPARVSSTSVWTSSAQGSPAVFTVALAPVNIVPSASVMT